MGFDFAGSKTAERSDRKLWARLFGNMKGSVHKWIEQGLPSNGEEYTGIVDDLATWYNDKVTIDHVRAELEGKHDQLKQVQDNLEAKYGGTRGDKEAVWDALFGGTDRGLIHDWLHVGYRGLDSRGVEYRAVKETILMTEWYKKYQGLVIGTLKNACAESPSGTAVAVCIEGGPITCVASQQFRSCITFALKESFMVFDNYFLIHHEL